MMQTVNRRQFVQAATLISSGYWICGSSAARESKSPNDRIRFACVGVGGRGATDSKRIAEFGDVVAICDVDERKMRTAAANYPTAKQFFDYRMLLDEMGQDIDAVAISTPDHTHAPIAARAMSMGKHCFCQKPLTRSIQESRKLAEIARKSKVATQMGTQGAAMDEVRKAAAVLRTGVLGDIHEIHLWTDRPIWPQGISRPKPTQKPGHVHWDEWQGPVAHRRYADGYHPRGWRGFWEYGTGALGDMGIHLVGMPDMALGLRNPSMVEAVTAGHNQISYPKWSIVTFHFPATSRRGPIKLIWYDGGKTPPTELLQGELLREHGALVIGTKGSMYAPGCFCEVNGHKLLGGLEEPRVEFTPSPGNIDEWVREMRGGPKSDCNFENYSAALTEMVLVGNLAVWSASDSIAPGKAIQWDPKSMTAVNAPEVAHLIKPEFHNGYEL